MLLERNGRRQDKSARKEHHDDLSTGLARCACGRSLTTSAGTAGELGERSRLPSQVVPKRLERGRGLTVGFVGSLGELSARPPPKANPARTELGGPTRGLFQVLSGSGGGTRTPGPAVNSRLLYQLSYSGMLVGADENPAGKPRQAAVSRSLRPLPILNHFKHLHSEHLSCSPPPTGPRPRAEPRPLAAPHLRPAVSLTPACRSRCCRTCTRRSSPGRPRCSANRPRRWSRRSSTSRSYR